MSHWNLVECDDGKVAAIKVIDEIIVVSIYKKYLSSKLDITKLA